MRASGAGSRLRWKSHPSLQQTRSGKSHFLFLLVVAFFFVTGGMYIFAVNERAVYGYDIRGIEKELAKLKKENAQLRLQEAAGRSLSRVEAGSMQLRMEKAVPQGELVIGRLGPVAFR